MPWRKGNRLRLVSEADADEATRRIFAEIKQALGLTRLELFYPALAVYPAFLRLHWETVGAIAPSRELFSAAERLRADAYTRAHNYFRVPDLSTHQRTAPTDGPVDIAAIAEFYHYIEPLLLLLACYQMQALEGATGDADVPVTPQPAPPSVESPGCTIDESSASPALKKLFEETRRVLDVPFVSPEFLAFACRPEFLRDFWSALKQMLASPVYDECRYGVRSTAWSLASHLPGPAELTVEQLADAGMAPEEIASVARILELFVTNLSGQLLNMAAAKIAIEGGNLAVPEAERTSGPKSKSPAA